MSVGENIKLAIVADLDAYRRADSDRIGFAIACGQKLKIAKADMAHGEWLDFLKEVDLPTRTASRWMAIADLSVEDVKAAGGIARAAAAANLSPAQMVARYRDCERRIVENLEKQVATYQAFTAESAETGKMSRLAVREIWRESGLTDAEIKKRTAAIDREIEAGLAKIRDKHKCTKKEARTEN